MNAPNPDPQLAKVTRYARFLYNEVAIPLENPTRTQRLAAIEAAALLIQTEVLTDARSGQSELLLALMTASDHTGTKLPDAMMSALTVLRQLANPDAAVKLDA